MNVPIRRMIRHRRGAAVAEFAILLPLLAFLFAIAIDYGRIYYYTIICQNCARNGCIWQSDIVLQSNSPYANVTAAATADATDLSPTPTVTSSTGTDAFGAPYVQVTVQYTFTSVTNFPLIPSTYTITRTVQMYPAPATPQ
jgi:Flp pilus assembly protein TadG